MGKGGGGSQPQQQNVVQTNLPEYARPYFENIMQRAQAESYRGYTPYEAERIAGFTPEQMQTQQETMGLRTPGEFGAGSQFAAAGGLGSLGLGAQAAGAGQRYMGMATDPNQMQAFMSPYQQAVTDVQKQAAVREAQIAQQQANLGAARQGTYGGARQAIAQAERERGLLDRLSMIQGQGSQTAFEKAQQAQQFGSTLGLQGMQAGLQGLQQVGQAGATLGQLGTQGQTANLQRLAAQETVGAQQRALQQQILDQRYADFLRQRDYPMEQLGYFSNLMRGIPIQLGSTQTTYAAPPSIASQVGGLGLAGLSMASLGKSAGLFAKGGEVAAYAPGGSVVSGPSPEELHRMGSGIGDEDLKAMENRLLANAPSKPRELNKLLMVAGELQAREDFREKAAKPKVYDTTLIADLLTGGAMPQMPQQVAMLPENAGGIAAMEAPNMENVEAMAAGGLVAFEDGGPVARYDVGGGVSLTDVLRTLNMDERRFYQQTGRLPPRAQAMLTGQAPMPAAPTPGMGMAGTGPATISMAADPNAPAQVPLPENMRFYPGTAGLIQGRAANVVPTAAPVVAPTDAAGPNVVAPAAGTDKPTVRLKDEGDLSGIPAIGMPKYGDPLALGALFAGDTTKLKKELDELPSERMAVEKQFGLYKEMGVDLDPYKELKERLLKDKSEEGKAKKEAGLMRLAEFGFNWASQNGPTLQAAAKAGKDVAPGLMSDLKELNKLARERDKALADIKATDSKMRKDITDAGLAKLEKRRDKLEGRIDAINDNAARISGSIYGQQLASQTQLATTGMTTRATIAKLEQQLGEEQVKNIVNTAKDMLTKDASYPIMTDAEKDAKLASYIAMVQRSRTAAGTTVTPR